MTSLLSNLVNPPQKPPAFACIRMDSSRLNLNCRYETYRCSSDQVYQTSEVCEKWDFSDFDKSKVEFHCRIHPYSGSTYSQCSQNTIRKMIEFGLIKNDTQTPRIDKFTPANSSTLNKRKDPFSIRFSELIYSESVRNLSISLKENGNSRVFIKEVFNLSTTSILIFPDPVTGDWLSSATYELKVQGEIKDYTGNSTILNETIQFSMD